MKKKKPPPRPGESGRPGPPEERQTAILPEEPASDLEQAELTWAKCGRDHVSYCGRFYALAPTRADDYPHRRRVAWLLFEHPDDGNPWRFREELALYQSSSAELVMKAASYYAPIEDKWQGLENVKAAEGRGEMERRRKSG